MIVDTSAVLAILFSEADAKRYAGAIMATTPCRMSIASVLEASIVVESRGGAAAGHELDALLAAAEIESMPVTVGESFVWHSCRLSTICSSHSAGV